MKSFLSFILRFDFQVAKKILSEAASNAGPEAGGSIVLNATAEFCRTLGDIPTYGLSGNRDEAAEEMMVSWKNMSCCPDLFSTR